MEHDLTLFGELRCHKTRFYRDALMERGVAFELAEVDKAPEAARRLTALAGDASKFPTLAVKGRKLRNPTLPQLDKELAHAGLFDPGLVHDARSQRFVRHMSPTDAFVSYSWQGGRMVLGHIEVDPRLRGLGIGTRLAKEVFDMLGREPHEIRLTCPFLRKVAATRAEWRKRFNMENRNE
ncbi:GNAT family N-acetyltransferase [Oceaniglobus trochenteri]|uniref:GNAT family N-acetyltransferase n=1 Tax=Oceaniglobus trochenteri TaxID=2763260 RepID=UPI001D000521|nr:GNAT family N-acetyltransferase [Oceaniglobus trochenteri]